VLVDAPIDSRWLRLPESPTRALDRVLESLRGRDVIQMATGRPGLPPPRWLLEWVAERVRSGGLPAFNYTPSGGLREAREAVARDLAELGGPRLSWEDVVLTAGGQNAVLAALTVLGEPGGGVVLFEPGWFAYLMLVEAAGKRPVFVPLEPPDYRIDLDAVTEALEGGARVIVVADPDNPTGRLLEPGEARGLAELAEDHGAWLVVDEPYQTLVYEGSKVYPYNYAPDNVVGLGALSKDPGIPGWRLGYAYGPREAVRAIERFVQATVYCPPRPAQELAIHYLSDPRRWDHRRRAVEEYRRRRDILAGALEELLPQARFRKPPAGMFIYADLSPYTGSEPGATRELSVRALSEAGVAFIPGEAFGPGQAGRARLTFTFEPPERLAEGVRRLARLLVGDTV
jgi:aspartate aminotransferase